MLIYVNPSVKIYAQSIPVVSYLRASTERGWDLMMRDFYFISLVVVVDSEFFVFKKHKTKKYIWYIEMFFVLFIVVVVVFTLVFLSLS